MDIKGLNKLTLLDFPGKMACTVFLPACNFRCPFCHNASLVLRPASQPDIQESEFFDYLQKRKGIIEGVCVTGGEPTLESGLLEFVKKIKDLGYAVKLDSNGYKPEVLVSLLPYLDYVAMDIKNSREKYALTTGLKNLDIKKIEESVEILKSGKIESEFRTTVVPELQEESDFESIGRWLKGSKKLFLQPFKDSGDVIGQGYTTPSEEFLEKAKKILNEYIEKVEIRG